jgi:predicted ester cyclase
VRGFYQSIFAAFDYPKLEFHEVFEDADRLVIRFTLTGTHRGEFMGVPPTQRSVAVKQVHIVRFQDGKGIEHWAVRDDLTLLRQLGVLPTERPGAPATTTA